MIRRTAHPPTDIAISLVEESGRVQRVANFPVARHPGTIGEMRFGVLFQTTERQAGSHGRRASRSAGAGPAISRIVPWPNIPKMTYATEIANTGASPGA